MTNEDTTRYLGNDDDRTVIIPQPGGRGPSAPTPPPLGSASGGQTPGELAMAGINPLAAAAAPLLSLVPYISNLVAHDDVTRLREQALSHIRTFENEARARNIPPETSNTARYILCTVLDETVLNTIWGSASVWGNQTLLSTLYKDTSGGERFFAILDQLLRHPSPDLDLLELAYLCISLGFQGQYRVIDRGQEQLEQLRNVVFEQIRRKRGEHALELSPHWESSAGSQGPLRRYIPPWVVFAVTGALLATIFLGFSAVLEDTAEPTLNSLQELGTPSTTVLPATE